MSTDTKADPVAALAAVRTHDDIDLVERSRTKPVLLVFLRHLGCTFCREAAADVASSRRPIEQHADIAFVHMTEADRATRFFAKYDLADAHHISDPQQTLYRAFGLDRGSPGQLFGAKVWARGFQAGVLGGHWVGALAGDGFQMPGVFLISDARVVRSFRHRTAADRPDYEALAARPS